MGRPRIGETPMTAAERKRRSRAGKSVKSAAERIAELTRQLDEARHDLELDRRGDGRCCICRRRVSEVEVTLRHRGVFYCIGCIDVMHQQAHELTATQAERAEHDEAIRKAKSYPETLPE
jgi:hypothetical protein